ncbi:MAG TPA: AAA family ATPase [Gemmataceae bacterium]|nr:AAA family ATPase [Gemmataceae bacterium]
MTPCFPPVVRFDQVRAVPIRWLWEPYLARGKLAVLDGDVGVGKSFFAVDLAARLSRGGRTPDGSRRRASAFAPWNGPRNGSASSPGRSAATAGTPGAGSIPRCRRRKPPSAGERQAAAPPARSVAV